MKKIISFSLFGTNPKYVDGMFENCKRAPVVYPGWEVRVYTEPGHPAVGPLRDMQAAVVEVEPNYGFKGAFWRFYAAEDPEAEAIIFRDSDSRLGLRERAAVDMWLASGKKAHTMHDHSHHAGWPLMSGMWGVRGSVIMDMTQACVNYGRFNERLDDMTFLTSAIWPCVQDSCMQHGYGGEPFPSHGNDDVDYVGQIWEAANDKDTTRNSER
jgi:hypothetical protein